MTRDQAEGIANALAEAMSSAELATKTDTADIRRDLATRTDLAETKTDILKTILGAVAINAAVVIGAMFGPAKPLRPLSRFQRSTRAAAPSNSGRVGGCGVLECRRRVRVPKSSPPHLSDATISPLPDPVTASPGDGVADEDAGDSDLGAQASAMKPPQASTRKRPALNAGAAEQCDCMPRL